MQLGSRAAERYLFKMDPGAPRCEEMRKAIKARAAGIARGGLPAIASDHHGRAGSGDDVFEPGELDCADRRRDRRRHGDARALAAEDGQHRGDEIDWRDFERNDPHLYFADADAGRWWAGWRGCWSGAAVEQIFPLLITKFFASAVAMGWHIEAAAQGIAVGMLTTLLFTVPPLLAIRKIRPAMILRRDMPEAGWRGRKRIEEMRGGAGGRRCDSDRHRRDRGMAGGIAAGRRLFRGGLASACLRWRLVAWLLLRGLAYFCSGSPWRIPSLVRQGLANLYRQGNQAQAILVALGLGVMFTLTVYLVQDSLVSQIIETAPPEMPNVFLVGVTQAQVGPLKELIAKQAGVQGSAGVRAQRCRAADQRRTAYGD